MLKFAGKSRLAEPKNASGHSSSMSILKIFTKFGHTAARDRNWYWEYQQKIGAYLYESILKNYPHNPKILDVGCGEGGVLSFFQQRGYVSFGIEISPDRVEYARQKQGNQIHFFLGNIENFDCTQSFDVILLLDVIEHVADKTRTFLTLKKCLAPNGWLLVTFPPYRSAFGGHQQTLRSFLKYIPYWHLLPRKIYIKLFEWFEKDLLESRLEIYDRGLTVRQFQTFAKQAGMKIVAQKDYFIRPRQALRFGLNVYENKFPFLKEYISTGVTCLLTHQVNPI